MSVSPGDASAQFLLYGLADEYSQRYGGDRQVHLGWLRMPCAEVAPPDGGLLIGVLDGVPVNEPLPSWGPFEPTAFAKSLP